MTTTLAPSTTVAPPTTIVAPTTSINVLPYDATTTTLAEPVTELPYTGIDLDPVYASVAAFALLGLGLAVLTSPRARKESI